MPRCCCYCVLGLFCSFPERNLIQHLYLSLTLCSNPSYSPSYTCIP